MKPYNLLLVPFESIDLKPVLFFLDAALGLDSGVFAVLVRKDVDVLVLI